jgi:hypothetical protein
MGLGYWIPTDDKKWLNPNIKDSVNWDLVTVSVQGYLTRNSFTWTWFVEEGFESAGWEVDSKTTFRVDPTGGFPGVNVSKLL